MSPHLQGVREPLEAAGGLEHMFHYSHHTASINATISSGVSSLTFNSRSHLNMQSRTLGNSSVHSSPWTEQHSTPNSHQLAKAGTGSRSTNPFQSAPSAGGNYEGRPNGSTMDQPLGSRANVSSTTDDRALEDSHRGFSKVSISRPDDEDHLSIGTSPSEIDPIRASSQASSPEQGFKDHIPKHNNDPEDDMKLDQERITRLEELVRNLSAQIMKGKEEIHSVKSVSEDVPQISPTFVLDGDNSRIKDMRISIPSLNFLKQDEWKSLDGKPIPSVHYAIDVLVDEVTSPPTDRAHPGERLPAMDLSAIDLDAMAWLDERELSQVQQSDLKELPEKIRINSRRLQCLLDHDLWDGSLNYTGGQPYTILRPFKILIYQEAKIRQRLREFEEARKKSSPQSGEEYLSHFKSDPAPDDAPRERQEPSSMTISELTGAINDFQCLVKFIDEYITPVKSELEDRPRQVRFSNLWYLFPPGSLVYVKDKNIPQKIWKVIQRTGGRRYLSRPDGIREGQFQDKYTQFFLDCYHLDFDGSGFVQTFGKFSISKFDDVLNISSLPVFPFEIALKERLTSRAELEARGRQFTYCTELRHQYYSGRSQYRAPNGRKFSEIPGIENSGSVTIFSETIESQVMIDFERALQEVPDWRPGLEELKPQIADVCEYEDVFAGKLDRDTVWDTRFTDEFMETESERWRKWKSRVNIPSGDLLLLLPDRVFGFVFRSRKWACLQLGPDNNREEQLRDINPNPSAWNDLELPPGHKHVIQSLIHSHFDKKKNGNRVEYDLVRDKGKGVILLLHGVPGVGKTSTAECVAESTQRPLLPITCGDLGLSPKDVETNLQSAFRLAEAWDCVLLLDEADIFLDQRATGDIARNSLVSVFLRVLEYYDGILFLTTNRVGTFDEAFKSRIHMALYYPPLNWQQTEKIWRSLIRRTREQNSQVECDESELVQYAQELFDVQKNGAEVGPVWNGRQLRNAFQSAIALAGFSTSNTERISLRKQHFQKVADVSHHFNNYLWRVKKGQSDGEMMGKNMIRHDRYDPVSIGNSSQQGTPASFSAPYSNGPQPRATFSGQNLGRVPSPAPQQGLPITQVLPQQSQHFVNPNSFQQPQGQFQQTSIQPQTYWNPTQVQAQQLQPQQFQQQQQQQQPGLYNPALQYATYSPVNQFQSPSILPQQIEQISQASQQQQSFGGYPQDTMQTAQFRQQQQPVPQNSKIQQQNFNANSQERPYQQIHQRGQSQDSGIGTDIPGGNLGSSGQLGTVVDSPRTSPQVVQDTQFGAHPQQQQH